MSESRLDKLFSEMNEIKIILAKNTSSLETHIFRTELLEEQTDFLRDEQEAMKIRSEERFRIIMESIKETIKPFEKHIAFVKGAVWSAGIAGALILGAHQLGIFTKLFS